CPHRRKFVSAELVAAHRACAVCDGFGFVPNSAAAFGIFYWLQDTNFQVPNFGLLKSAPNRTDYSDIRRSVLHNQLLVATFALGCSTDTLLASVLIVYHSLDSPACAHLFERALAYCVATG